MRVDRRYPCVYVGVTALTPRQRYAKHREGGQTAAGIVRDHGVGLLESLYRDRNPLPAKTEEDFVGNVGTAPGPPSPPASQAGYGQARRRLTAPGWGGAPVVVGGRESRPHGEGGERVRSKGTGMPGGRR